MDISTSNTTPTKLDAENQAAYMPLSFLVDFFKFLKRNRKLIRTITYDDLAWTASRDPAQCYIEEKAEWRRRQVENPEVLKIEVLIQHDVDNIPLRTENLLRFEEAAGIRSTVMIFNHRIHRRRLFTSNQLGLTDYSLDFEYLNTLEAKGFVVGYHCNAYERARFDENLALQIMRDDIDELSQRVRLCYMSAHGGVASPEHKNNRDLPFLPDISDKIRWVHNGHTPWFTKSFSDGGINNRQLDPAQRDLRDFVRTWCPGGRYRVLLHPQYYDSSWIASPGLDGAAWYDAVLANYRQKRPADTWRKVEIAPYIQRKPAPRWPNSLKKLHRNLSRIFNGGRTP